MIASAGTRATRPSPANEAVISPVAVALAAHEVSVRDLTLRTPTLDDVFLDLTGTRIEIDEPQEVLA